MYFRNIIGRTRPPQPRCFDAPCSVTSFCVATLGCLPCYKKKTFVQSSSKRVICHLVTSNTVVVRGQHSQVQTNVKLQTMRKAHEKQQTLQRHDINIPGNKQPHRRESLTLKHRSTWYKLGYLLEDVSRQASMGQRTDRAGEHTLTAGEIN